MRIVKPLRIVLASSMAGIVVGLEGVAIDLWLLSPWRSIALTLLIPSFFVTLFVMDHLVSVADLGLRRMTRDPVWLLSHEGRDWRRTRRK